MTNIWDPIGQQRDGLLWAEDIGLEEGATAVSVNPGYEEGDGDEGDGEEEGGGGGGEEERHDMMVLR